MRGVPNNFATGSLLMEKKRGRRDGVRVCQYLINSIIDGIDVRHQRFKLAFVAVFGPFRVCDLICNPAKVSGGIAAAWLVDLGRLGPPSEIVFERRKLPAR